MGGARMMWQRTHLLRSAGFCACWVSLMIFVAEAAPLRWMQSGGSLVGIRNDGAMASWFMPDVTGASMVAETKEKDPLPPGLCFGLKLPTGLSWLTTWTCAQKMAENGAPVLVTSFTSAGTSLSGEVTTFFAPSSPVLLYRFVLKNSAEEPVQGATVVLLGRLHPGTDDESRGVVSTTAPFLGQDGKGAFLGIGSDKAPVLTILGSKEKGEALAQLESWASGGQIVPATELSGKRLSMAAAWEVGEVKKDADASLLVAISLSESANTSKDLLAPVLTAKVDDLLAQANGAVSAGLPANPSPQLLSSMRLLKTLTMPSGAIVSAYPPFWGCRIWDAALASIALSSSGQHAEAKAWLTFASGLDKGIGGWSRAYGAKGQKALLPLASVDGTGLLVYAYLVEGRQDKAFLEGQWERIKGAAEFLSWWQSPDGIPAPSLDRESGQVETGTWSLAHAYTGLASASEIARILGKPEASRYESRALKMKESLGKDLTSATGVIATFARLSGLTCEGLEGWKGIDPYISVLDNLNQLPGGASGQASQATLASLVWPAGLAKADAANLGQEGKTGLDRAMSTLALKSSGGSTKFEDDPESGETTLATVAKDRLSQIPSLTIAAANCLASAATFPAPPALSGGGKPAAGDKDFVTELKSAFAQQDVVLEIAPDKVEMSFSLGDVMGQLPEALTLASAPTFPGAAAIPADAEAVLALAVSDDRTKWSGLSEWLCGVMGMDPKDSGASAPIKLAVGMLLQMCDPEIDIGFMNLTSGEPIVVLTAMKVKPDKAAQIGTAMPMALSKILTDQKVKFEQTQSDAGIAITLTEPGISIIFSPEYLLIAYGKADVVSKAMAAAKDPAQSMKPKIPSLQGVGPLTLYVDTSKVALAGANLPGFSKTFPGWKRAQNFVLTVQPTGDAKGGPKLLLRMGLGAP